MALPPPGSLRARDQQFLRRTALIVSAVAVATLSCGREPTAPAGPARVVYSRALAWAPQWPAGFQTLYQQFQAAGGGTSGVEFTRVRIVLNNPDGTVALDTTVNFPAGATELPITLSVPLPASAPATGVPLALNLAYLNAAGETVFRGGPVTVTAVPATPGAGPPPPAPVTIPITYTGPGASATGVIITPRTLTVNTGQAFSFTARAVDAAGTTVANTPIVFTSTNPVVATVNAATGQGAAGAARGTTTILAQLLTGPSDGATLTVVAPPASLAAVSGSGQTGPVNAVLAQPVVVRVAATDGQPASGVTVTFAAQNGGSVGQAAVTTGADGTASTTWRLGPTPGSQGLTASAAGLTGSPVAFTATARAIDPVRLEVTTPPPATTGAGAPFGLVVRAVDATGALTPQFTGAVTVALQGVAGAALPTGATLAGTATVNAVAGVATFTDLRVPVPGTYVLAVSTAGLVGATTGSFAITAGTASRLAFQNYPVAGATAGTTFDPVTVVVRDALGNTVTGFTGNVTLTAVAATAAVGDSAAPVPEAGAPSGTEAAHSLSGTTTVAAVAGVATFPGLRVTTAGSWVLTATATGLTSATGPVFAIAPGPASALTLVSGGGQSAAGAAALGQPVVVKVADAFGNGVGGVTVSFAPLAGSGSVSPTSAVSQVGTGLAQTAWTLGGVAGTMTLNVSGPGLLPNPLVVNATATSTTVAGAATKVVITTQPSTVAAGAAITPAIVVTAKDANALTATSFTGSVTLQISTNPAGGTLSGTTTVAAVAGVATFPGLSINNAGIGYRIRAFSGVLAPDTSVAFNVTGAPVATTAYTQNLDSLYSLGDTVRRVPVSRDAATNVVPGIYTYVSRNPAVATVSTTGLVTAIANGATYVVATEAGGTKDSTRVVVQQRVATISVTPGTRSIYRTRTFQFSAAAVDGRGNPMPGGTVFTWTTLATAVATVDANGLLTAVGLGGTQVRATSGAITGVANVTVLTPISRIIVGRDSSGVPVTDTTAMPSLGIGRRYRAEARDTLDAPMSGVTFAWNSTNSSVALLDSITATTARALSNANGITTIQATADGVTGSATLKVQQLLASIELTPTPDTIGITGTVQLTARGKDANNRYISGGSFSFTSANPAIATVNATTGVVSGVALGTTSVTATSGAITSNAATIVVSTTVPASISFGRDTLTVGRGGSVSIPIFLSRPNASNVTVNLAARDTNAYFSVGSITFTPGQTALNVTLNGRNAGTTLLYATDGSGTGFAGDTAAVAIQANVRFAQTNWYLNATDQVASQVLLSDPSPAGGTFVTFAYGTAGRASVSPDPAFIPAGQLASNVVITALGSTTGSTTITPSATGVNGTASTLQVAAPILYLSATNRLLGAGQFESGVYAYTYYNTTNAIPVTFRSTDTSVATVTPAGTIPAGSYYTYFTISGKATGTSRIIVSATGWQPDTILLTVTSPRVTVCCGTTLNTTSPTTSFTTYATDSVGNGHYRTSSLALTVTSSDTNVIRIIDATPSIAAGQYYASGIRYQPGGSGGTAYIKVTAGGHRPDSMLVTVVGPKLQFSWCCTNNVGKGQYDQNVYVYTPNNVVSALTVTLTSADTNKVKVPATVTVPAGSYYAYFNVTGADTGVVSIIATAPGYQPDTAFYRVSSPRVTISGGGTHNNFRPPAGFTVYATDSVGSAHYRTTPLAVSLRSTDTTVIRVDSATRTITTGNYYTSAGTVSFVGTGTAYLVATATGHRPDSVLYTVVTPKLNISFNTYNIGRRQFRTPTDFYVYTPNSRTVSVPVTLTQTNAAADSLTATSLTIPANSYYAYFGLAARAFGVDTIIATATGYMPDTAYVRITTPRLYYAGGLPSNATTTAPPSTVTIYATDSLNGAHYSLDTLVIRAVSSDTTVIKPAQRYFRLIRGQYYVQPTVNYVGPGTASITYSDSAGTGYLSTTTNTVTVTGPSLVFSTSSVMYGMRQRSGSTDIYVYTANNVASALTVNLVSTDTRVATVPATVTIPAGSYYAYFTVSAQDTVGTIQIQANAVGYGPPTPMTVQVTQPRFVFSVSTSARTTSGPQSITVYAADANGNSHYVTENVTVNLASSSGAVFTVDSASVVIPAGSYYNNNARWRPVAVGSAQLSATDPRAAIYKYNTGTANVSVINPNLYLSWNSTTLGLGQYVDPVYDGSFYVYTSDYQPSALTVTLSHGATPRTATPATVSIPASNYYQYFRITATSFGTDTIIASAASPFHIPDSATVVVDSGRIDGIVSWPTSIVAGDSVAVTLRIKDPSGNIRRVAAATTFALAPNANIQFRSGGAAITTVTVPADATQVTFYVKGLSAGTGTATITNAAYKVLNAPSITVTP